VQHCNSLEDLGPCRCDRDLTGDIPQHGDLGSSIADEVIPWTEPLFRELEYLPRAA
jgi:hypothetical protein